VVDRPPYYQFLTAKLWDTGNSGPWGHRNDLDTIYEAIVAHGGEAQSVRDAFEALSNSDQIAVVTFLKSLRMPIMDNNPPPQLEGSPTAPNPAGNTSFP
jgi:Di-haem oxidoreductase, putative peroxidase